MVRRDRPSIIDSLPLLQSARCLEHLLTLTLGETYAKGRHMNAPASRKEHYMEDVTRNREKIKPAKSKGAPLVCRLVRFLNGSHAHPYKITYSEEMLLVTIANYDGFTGCHPTITTLMKERQIEKRNLRNMIKKLKNSGLISVEKIGRNNHYTFPILDFYDIK